MLAEELSVELLSVPEVLLFAVELVLPEALPLSAELLVVLEPLQAESIDVAIAAVTAQASILFESFILVLLLIVLVCIRLHQDIYIITETVYNFKSLFLQFIINSFG